MAEPQEYNQNRASRVQSHEFQREHQPPITNDDRNVLVPEYFEEEPNVVDYGKDLFGNPLSKFADYLISLFPIAKWILHYNTKWLYGDLIAGITVGVVLVPQSMSYALLAGLSPEYGLYSSFVGVFIYSFFATSKDVSIGPVAVMSLQVGKVISKVQNEYGDTYSAPEIATFLSLICGGIATAIGILRLGFILEFISMPAVMGFMSGSAFNIITGQVPALMGYNSSVNTKITSFHTVIATLKKLPLTNVNAAFGLVPLVILYVWKFSCEYLGKRYPRRKMWFFYLQQLRNAIVIVVASAIAWGIVHPELVRFNGSKSDFSGTITTIGEVPSGLKHVGVLAIPDGIIGAMASEIPVSTIILLLEHIAISKSFGRVNDYKVIPDQELIAIGVNNLIGTFFNAYPATGSFSRSALKAKCGVRTPLAGIFTGGVVLLALYVLTEAFYYIPKATLSAVIIHAVSDLFTSWRSTWNLWEVNPIDCGIFLIAVIITVFSSIENGIYFAIAASAAVLLFRIAKPSGQFLGRIRVAEVVNPVIQFKKEESFSSESSDDNFEIQQVLSRDSYQSNEASKLKSKDTFEKQNFPSSGQLVKNHPNIRFVSKWVPLSKKGLNDDVDVLPPPPGVIVFRPLQSFSYPNASGFIDQVSDEAKRITRRGRPYSSGSVGDRPWNDPGPLRWSLFKKKTDVPEESLQDERPLLKIVHFDFSCVPSIDASSVQALTDLRRALNNYADREVEFHFSGIHSPWVRRGLIKAGFGTYGEDELVSERTYVNIATAEGDLETGAYHAAVGTNTPFLHLEIPEYL
ncbi:sulfate permease [Metschnikowia bicuspidata var. bicuspidata NRRL YB-4993]|uniref:Sulfate permease n=1 Tax=Metschnikowia bicuspidata var. bicuspidata NRRL YB-4993 TaxID=869754 RepID=A0A1A0HJU5_9ASCO|nr:sulfate permease [Metschnikowia bicuspidata var. bicuspidata NRRL YB-4993]OBA24271.1 sulfate permease [Metschnikowia bicuspidata var. bicuspidata NRRL YB-4993]